MSAKLVLTVKDSSRMAKDYSMSMMDKMFHPLKHNKILNFIWSFQDSLWNQSATRFPPHYYDRSGEGQ